MKKKKGKKKQEAEHDSLRRMAAHPKVVETVIKDAPPKSPPKKRHLSHMPRMWHRRIG